MRNRKTLSCRELKWYPVGSKADTQPLSHSNTNGLARKTTYWLTQHLGT